MMPRPRLLLEPAIRPALPEDPGRAGDVPRTRRCAGAIPMGHYHRALV